ncbi:extensin-2-like [Humulus lupulus]|uniref:extensin-2-like n=1 Tax=Humulus lupulus TaxID=3486 RepID=UPI002B407D90|nr:extensin-2-like [Humulus lupulus]
MRNFNLPANANLLISTVPLHHDPDIWGQEFHLFKPERFSEGVAKATKDNMAAFLPFGMGPRTCAGVNFASIEAKIALTMIMQRYSFTLSPAYVHSLVNIPTNSLQHGVQGNYYCSRHYYFYNFPRHPQYPPPYYFPPCPHYPPSPLPHPSPPTLPPPHPSPSPPTPPSSHPTPTTPPSPPPPSHPHPSPPTPPSSHPTPTTPPSPPPPSHHHPSPPTPPSSHPTPTTPPSSRPTPTPPPSPTTPPSSHPPPTTSPSPPTPTPPSSHPNPTTPPSPTAPPPSKSNCSEIMQRLNPCINEMIAYNNRGSGQISSICCDIILQASDSCNTANGSYSWSVSISGPALDYCRNHH